MKNNPIFDRLFGPDGIHPFGNPFRFEEYIKETFDSFENLTEEKLEFERGEFKTTIILKFNQKGFPVSHRVESVLIPQSETLDELKSKLQKAVEKEDYSEAAKIQKTIRSLEEK